MIAQRLIVIVVSLLTFILPDISTAYKVLILPVHSKSHIACMLAIADELDRRGHDVHMLSFDKFGMTSLMKSQTTGSTVKQFEFQLNKELTQDESRINMVTRLNEFIRRCMAKRTWYEEMLNIMDDSLYLDLCDMIALNTDEAFEKLKKEKFDLMVLDGTTFSKCFYLIPHRLGIPWITYTDYTEEWLMRTPSLTSFVPQHYSKFTERMTFAERLKNTLLTTYIYLKASQLIVSDAILTQYSRYGDFDTLDDLTRRSEFFLITNDVVLDYAKPSMPNIAEVGGLTTKEPKPLTADFLQFVDGAEKGVIVMTFGGMLPVLQPDLFDKFVSAFRRLDGYRVIWRIINHHNITLPSNLMISSWLPQNDILGHPKTKLFITHGGNNGQYEAVYNKVPMIGFPLFADQEYNAMRVEYKGFGLAMDIFDFTSDQLLSNIQKILSDPMYASRLSLASDIFKSATKTPAERAATWIEHVLTFGGSHLRSAGSDLPMYQYLLLDVLVTCVVAVSIAILVIYKLLFFIRSKLLGKKSNVIPENRKKQ